MIEQTKMVESATSNEEMVYGQKERLLHFESINEDLDRQLQDSLAELTELNTESREYREVEA